MGHFDSGWQSWLHENVQRGCAPESILAAMVAAGIDPAIATVKLAQALAPAVAPAVATSGRSVDGHESDPMPVAAGNRIDLGDRIVAVALRSERPQIVVFNEVLSDDECDQLIERSRTKLKRSTTVNPITGEHDVIDRRTSEGTYFDRCEDAFITRIDTRVSKLMGWPMNNGEGLQILHYGIGGEYKPHFDYFPPDEAGSAAHMAAGGQRVSTLIVYLNDVAEGGETIFPRAGLSVSPRRGSAVYFRYCNAKGQIDTMTLHGGAPVLAGEKWIMTKWMRQRPYGPAAPARNDT